MSTKFVDVFKAELEVINFRRQSVASGGVARARLGSDKAIDQTPQRHLVLSRREIAVATEGSRAEALGTTRLTVASDLTGLALSGGGIRSAAFSLGVLQALDSLTNHEEPHVLDAVDYLSTVSGGGYIGASLISGLMQPDHSFPFDSRLDQQETPEMQHLRDYSNYLVPSGAIDYVINATLVLRGLLVNAVIVMPALLFLASITLLAKPTISELQSPSIFGFDISRLSFEMITFGGLAHFALSLNLLLAIALFLYASAIYTSLTFRTGTLKGRELLGRILACLLIAVFITALLEAQPFVLSGMVRASAGTESLALAEGPAKDLLGWFGTKLPALASVLAPMAAILVATAQKLANLAKASVGEATWSAWIKKNSSRLALYASGVVVPLLLWIFYLYLVFWAIRDAAPPNCGANTPEWLASITGCSAGLTKLLPTWTLPLAERLGPIGVFYVALSLIVTIICLFIGPNANSLHRLYRDRLSRAFLFPRSIKSKEDFGLLKFSALKPRSQTGSWLPGAALAPYLLTNTAINLEASRELNKRGRNADSFIFSPLYFGSRATGYVETIQFEKLLPDLSLATAMATSGAAASANMGTSTKKILTFSLSLLNVRLGYWLANPARIGAFTHWPLRWIANVGTWYFASETAGLLDERKLNVYLTDGGHIENLGIYELLRRRCKVILAVDAEADPDMTFPSLIALQVMARIDLGVTIDLPWEPIQKSALGITSASLYGPAGPPGTSGPHAAIGLIHYGADETGVLIYIKSSLSGDENDYILDYKRRNKSFPHETTIDQFFSEDQFETYRALGFHAARGLFAGSDNFAKPHLVLSKWADEVKSALLLLNIPAPMAENVLSRM
jgi:hypothetical protein